MTSKSSTTSTSSSPRTNALHLLLPILSCAAVAVSFSTTAASFATPPRQLALSRQHTLSPSPRSPPPSIAPLFASVSDDVSNLLYEEQEKLIVRRGEFEESLVTNVVPLEASAVKVRGVGGSGGFGGGKFKTKKKTKSSSSNPKNNNNNNNNSNNNNNNNNFQAEGEALARILQTEGVLRLDDVLPPATADALLHYVRSLRRASELQVRSGEVPPLHRFADVLLKSHRCDLPLPLGQSPLLSSALHSLLLRSPVASVVERVFGRDATLHEFSCLVSDPGSQRQVLHPDTPHLDGKGPVLYTCFVALQDVTPEMGPTLWMPGTHSKEAHDAFGDGSVKDDFLRNQTAVAGTLKKGDCAVFDSRVLHCGTANRSHLEGGTRSVGGTSRALFYFSFKNPEVGYTGNPASIRPEIGRAMVTLGELMEDLEGWDGRDGKNCVLIERLGKSLL
ncbi:hypothetical protein ACHAXS_012230 [Conticribra weissflogii]